jgi:hypothetical protein
MTMNTNRSCRAPYLLAGLLLLVLAPVSIVQADQVVYFVNGKAMTVKSVDRQAKLTFLEMDGGGRIGVPTEQIARIEEYQVSPPAVPVAATPVAVVPTPAAAPAMPGQPGAAERAAPAAALPSGPGYGGQPLNPQHGVGNLAPLQVGGSPQAGRLGYQTPSRATPQPGPGMGGPGVYRPSFVGLGARRGGRIPGRMGRPQQGQHNWLPPGAPQGAGTGTPQSDNGNTPPQDPPQGDSGQQ